MKKELNLSNVLISLIMLTVGVILVINSDVLINAMSWVIGAVVILISIIKIIYLFNDKILDTTALAINIFLMIYGVVLISFPPIVGLSIRIIFGCWILFAAVKRLILAVTLSRVDRVSYRMYLISSLLMILLGGLVLTGLAFDFISGFVGIFLIIYSITEIVNYIFYLVNRKKYSNVFDKEEYDKENKRVKKKETVTKKLKEGKVIEADIEE